ncbi:MAG: UDP-N-acetylmuramate dehydrogenase [Myxococcaceae bacterium]
MKVGLADRILEVVEAAAGEVRAYEPMAPRLTVRAGGEAEVFFRPRKVDALVNALKVASEENAAITIIGGGANTLVGDYGIAGLTITLPTDFLPETIEKDEAGATVTLCAGSAINRLTVVMKKHGLIGAEFLAGIPGTLGGAVTMNAGTKNGECMSIVDAIEVATADGIGWLAREKTPYRYRHTDLPERAVVTRVRFKVPFGDLKVSQAKIDADLSYRKRTQPLSQPNFGSVFKNPEGNHAGRLIEEAGLKGFTIGMAQISTLHANWIVNLGGASSGEIVRLMETAQKRVFEKSGVELQPEVKRVGRFAP